MIRPAALNPGPSILMLLIGGGVAVLLLSALTFLAPVLGFPFVDIPHLVGGIFTEDPTAAFWLGFAIFFLVGWFVFPPLFALAWRVLPGDSVSFGGALAKGLLWGVILWAVSGVLLPLFGWLNQLEALENPGLFALGEGVLGAVGLLLGHLAYGAALALVAAMSRNISPLDTLGWMGYRAGDLKHGATTTTYGS